MRRAFIPATQSAAAPSLPGGSGGAGTLLPRRDASASFPTQSIHDRRDQLADVNSLSHEVEIT